MIMKPDMEIRMELRKPLILPHRIRLPRQTVLMMVGASLFRPRGQVQIVATPHLRDHELFLPEFGAPMITSLKESVPVGGERGKAVSYTHLTLPTKA